MDFEKIAQELDKSFISLLNETYQKVYELSNNIESQGSDKPNFAQVVNRISSAENAFGVSVNQCKSKANLPNCLKLLKNWYSIVVGEIKAGNVKLTSSYDRNLLQAVADNYSKLLKMV